MLIKFVLFLLYSYCAAAAYIQNHASAVGRSSISDSVSLSTHESRDDPPVLSRLSRPHALRTTSPSTGTPCPGNSPGNRAQWCQYNISTDYTTVVPNTGVTREYWFDIDEVTVAPDGVPRFAMAINGSIPGPTIYADWGDTVVVHVTNHLNDDSRNGSSIHWHGIRQLNTNQNDGVVSITQCPITPGNTMTYKWRAHQYGSTWYHSHLGLQAWEGVFGGIVINGPATANYDVDKGTIILNDWSHQTADELWYQAESSGPPGMQNGLINGTNEYTSGNDTVGSRFTMGVQKGKSYRLRIVNAAIDTHFRFMVDNHTLTVISMDLVPIEPFTTDTIALGMGQRYDVIITANQAAVADSFWLRAIPQEACSADNESVDNIKGIVYYGKSPTTPGTSAFDFVDSCLDQPTTNLVPHVPQTVSAPDWSSIVDVTAGRNSANMFRWFINSTTLDVQWGNPTLLQVANNESTFADSYAVIPLPNANEWVYLVINTTFAVTHPIHLHGHDFFVLAQGSNPWDGTVQTANPPRRDTAMLPGNGYLVLAFETDNPGAWLMHCHIGWHTLEGFALQFLEQASKIPGVTDEAALQTSCAAWNTYDTAYSVLQEDSGI